MISYLNKFTGYHNSNYWSNCLKNLIAHLVILDRYLVESNPMIIQINHHLLIFVKGGN